MNWSNLEAKETPKIEFAEIFYRENIADVR